ncbi:MAG: YidC/Oxa1 family membrane protein insertase [Minisyncoccota bacterium]
MQHFFYVVFYQPLYNVLAFLVSVVPGGDMGIAAILLTVMVKFIILPFTHKSVVSQARMRELDPDLRKLREKHSENKEELARKTMELYKEKDINPFSGCLPLIIQVPVLMALYLIFYRGGVTIDPAKLYSFIPLPHLVSPEFLGFIDLSRRSIVLAVIAGAAQYLQMKITFPAPTPPNDPRGKVSFQDQFARSMHVQMRYIFPVMIAGISYVSGIVALYFIVSSLFAIGHDLFIKRSREPQPA